MAQSTIPIGSRRVERGITVVVAALTAAVVSLLLLMVAPGDTDAGFSDPGPASTGAGDWQDSRPAAWQDYPLRNG